MMLEANIGAACKLIKVYARKHLNILGKKIKAVFSKDQSLSLLKKILTLISIRPRIYKIHPQNPLAACQQESWTQYKYFI